MAVWWVFQNNSYERSRVGGYLWAPLVDKSGNRKSHWETMAQVQPGHLRPTQRSPRVVRKTTHQINPEQNTSAKVERRHSCAFIQP